MKYFLFLCLSLLSAALSGCHEATTGNAGDTSESVVTPISIAYPDTTVLTENIMLNATAAYLLKTDVKATVNGYIIKSAMQAGSPIQRGQTLFVLETKEARSIGDAINKLDSTFRFSGINSVKSPVTGYIIMLNHQQGDYVQDGEILASVADKSSFGFMLDLPYEYRQLLNSNKNVSVQLPDGTSFTGYVVRIMPSVDSIAQTQRIWIKIPGTHDIPENLIAKVLLTEKKSTHISLTKSAIFSDESQQHFWVMKLTDSATAIKIPIRKGIENDSLVEIVAPSFTLNDMFVTQGGYGLADTAKVSVQK